MVQMYHDETLEERAIPVREMPGQIGPTSGHLVCLADWAYAIEMIADRLYTGTSGPLMVYPTGVVDEVYSTSGEYPYGCAGWVNGYLSTALSYHIDATWTPVGGDGGWNWWGQNEWTQHKMQRCTPSLWNGNLRALDDLRRVFYDVKMTKRRIMGYTATYTIGGRSSAYYYPTVTQTGTGAPQLSTCDSAQAVITWAQMPQSVRDHVNFSYTPAFAMVDMYCRRYRNGGWGDAHQKHVVATLGVNGGVGISGWSASDLLTWMRTYYGSGTSGESYEAGALITGVYMDINYPLDGTLVPWNYQPSNQ